MLVLALWAGISAAQDFSGTASFGDADTAHIGPVKVRLFGIDAPELDQTCTRANGRRWDCGKWAARQARRLFDGRRLDCRARDEDQYGRIVATCWLDGEDIAEILVRRGIAQAYRRYSTDYVAAEKFAEQDRVGIWDGTMIAPAEFRRIRNAPVLTATPQGCAIKGNISGSGRIYHLPGQENYAATVISEAKGERWFCSEAEARAAGWRRAKR